MKLAAACRIRSEPQNQALPARRMRAVSKEGTTMMNGYGTSGGVGGGWLWWALIAVGVILIIVLIVRWASGRRSEVPPTGKIGPAVEVRSEARRILDGRYARGELDTAEYAERVRSLEETP